MNIEDFEEVVWGWVQESGSLIMEYFSETGLGFDRKEDGTPVTIADRNVELLLRKKINSNFPEHGILGEEFGSEKEEEDSNNGKNVKVARKLHRKIGKHFEMK